MGLSIGIVGLPNVGKSTLFNALSGASVLAANYPFATKNPNVGVVPLPDDRLDELAALYEPRKTTHAALEFVDIAGLVKGASKGEGLGNQFLANIREVDAIAHVLRCFTDHDAVHVDGPIDPARDREVAEKDGARWVAICSKVEAEIQQLPGEERAEFLAHAGLTEPGLNKLVRAGFDLLGLQSYFTVGEDECRAWVIKRGTRAPQAAGAIHTDFERGFIKAEVIRWDELLRHGSESAARAKGALRVEGKEYVVQDGDVIHFLFNV